MAAVALQAGAELAPAELAARAGGRARWVAYAARRRARPRRVGAVARARAARLRALELLAPAPAAGRAARAVAAARGRRGHRRPGSRSPGSALKVGALSYGGGFVIIPLMQADAVDRYHWMTDASSSTRSRWARSRPARWCTPSPSWATRRPAWAGAARARVAFAPSFSFVLIGAERFDRLRANPRVRAFLDGAGPAAIGAIAGSAVPLALALTEPWQFAVLAAAAVALFVPRRGVVSRCWPPAPSARPRALSAPLPS